MKRNIKSSGHFPKFALRTLLLLLALFSAQSSLADYYFSYGGIYYRTQGTTATVTNNYYVTYGGDITIPETVTYQGYTFTVTSIGEDAFYNSPNLTSIVLPNTITNIGANAFGSCINLNSVSLGDSIKVIGVEAFGGCTGLATFNMPKGIRTIGYGAFWGCTNLNSVSIPNLCDSIGERAFGNCIELACIIVDNENTVFDSRNNCNAIIKTSNNELIQGCKNTNIPNSVTSIGKYAFACCKGLSNIVIPNSINRIGEEAFMGCEGITEITIPKSVTSIQSNSFSYCKSVESIQVNSENPIFSSYDHSNAIIEKDSGKLIYGCANTVIPSFVTSIGEYAFCGCANLMNIVIPNSVSQIERYAFSECSKLSKIIIPDSLVTIGYYAFGGCVELENIKFGCSLTSIGSSAFSGCNKLTTIDLPQSLESIGNYAFNACFNLTSVRCRSLVPPIMGNTDCFSCYSTASLFVPFNSVEIYQATNWWKNFTNIFAYEPINSFTSTDTTCLAGNTIVIPVSLENESELTAFQTDLYLPEGFELVKEDGDYLVELSDRKGRDHVIMANDLDDGGIRIISYSTTVKPYSGNEGELFYIMVKTPNDGDGDYTIMLKNTLLTTTDLEELNAPDASCTVTVYPYIMGDANNSGTVTVTDIVVTARYILNYHPDPFVFGAADLNGDGNISVTDIVIMAQMIMDGTTSYPRHAPARGSYFDRMSGQVMNDDGMRRTVSIALDNAADYTAFQLDMQLPAGMTADNFTLTDGSGFHTLDVNVLDNGKTRLLCYNPTLKALNGDEETLLTFDVTSSIYGDIVVDGIEVVTADRQTATLDAFTIKMDNLTSVDELTLGDTVAKVEYFNLSGQQIERPSNGVTIVVTTFTNGTRSISKVVR